MTGNVALDVVINGGPGKMWQLFGDRTDENIGELNEVLAA